MNLRSQSQPAVDGILIVATVGRQPIFAACAKWPGFAGQVLLVMSASPARHRDGAGTAIMGICRGFESNLSGAAAHALKRDFDDGHE
jgi:hypothetical protein